MVPKATTKRSRIRVSRLLAKPELLANPATDGLVATEWTPQRVTCSRNGIHSVPDVCSNGVVCRIVIHAE